MEEFKDVNNADQSVTSSTAPLSDEQRRKLAEKLDKELDEFIGGLERRSYTEGWPEDRWQEEMEKHPFFMTKAPEEGEQLSPLMEGLQQLKYSETDNTPEELAATYKEDGNYNFKLKKYRLAIMSYTEGLKQKCTNDQLNSELYNNRSAAQFFLKNYRSCLADCKAALKLRPDYTKCKVRAIRCCFSLHRYDECIEICDDLLATSPTDKTALEMQVKAFNGKKAEERNARKEASAKLKEERSCRVLLNAIKERGIHLEGNELSLEALEPCSPTALQSRVHLDDDGCIIWPVMFLYPEYQVTDLIQEFHEDTAFSHHLNTMFEIPPDWDKDGLYVPNKLSIYYEDKSDNKLHRVAHSDTLRKILSKNSYVVTGGTPCFLIVIQESRIERHLLDTHNK